MENSVHEIVSHIKSLMECKISLLGIYYFYKEVHVGNSDFLNIFNNYKASERDSYEYPIELFEVVDGIRFYALFQIGDFHATK